MEFPFSADENRPARHTLIDSTVLNVRFDFIQSSMHSSYQQCRSPAYGPALKKSRPETRSSYRPRFVLLDRVAAKKTAKDERSYNHIS